MLYKNSDYKKFKAFPIKMIFNKIYYYHYYYLYIFTHMAQNIFIYRHVCIFLRNVTFKNEKKSNNTDIIGISDQ